MEKLTIFKFIIISFIIVILLIIGLIVLSEMDNWDEIKNKYLIIYYLFITIFGISLILAGTLNP